MKTRKKLAAVLGTSLLATCVTSNAALVAYTDEAVWNTALTTNNIVLNPTVETFEPGPVPEQIINNTATTTPNGLFNIFYTTQNGIDESKNKFEDNHLKLQFDTTNDTPGTPGDATTAQQFQFINPVSAFAADFFEISSSANLQLTVNGMAFNLRALFGQADSFFGVLATAGETFSSLSFSVEEGNNNDARPISDNFIVDDVRIGNVSSVPLPAAVWLMGTALLALAGIGRRKTRN